MSIIPQDIPRLTRRALRPLIGNRRSKKAGLPPGTLVHIGERRTEHIRTHLIHFNEHEFDETTFDGVGGIPPALAEDRVTWINISGIHDTEAVAGVGRQFGIHPLVQEDIVNTSQRPKMEDFEDHIFVVTKMLHHVPNSEGLRIEQVSLIVGSNYVLSFQEFEGDAFESIRNRLRAGKGRIRKQGADYLAYALLDALVDNYFAVVENLGEEIEALEAGLVANPEKSLLHAINTIKRDLIFLRRSIWPLREVLSALMRDSPRVIKPETGVYIRDVYDHTIQVVDIIETFRDIVGGMMDIYLSSLSNRMNEVIKFLTIIGTIFIPLTFIVGIYGMNFEYMPELGWRYGYFAVMLFMLAVSLGLLAFFRRKGWI